MDHFYRNLHGNFTFAEFYWWIVTEECHYDWRGVEVGALQGQSAAYLAVEMINNSHQTVAHNFDLVEREHHNCAALERNLAPVRSVIGAIHPCASEAASHLYKDASLDFVMLDAGHEYADLRSDIDAWWPKVKVGGILATHDFCHYFPGLMRAWLESFPRFNVWAGSEWPEDGDSREDARADLVNRSALRKDTDFLPVAWVRK